MKKRSFLYSLGVVLALAWLALAQTPTNVSGVIRENTRWAGVIRVDGDVTIARGVTLTIDSGSRIIFLPHTDRLRGGSDPKLAELIVLGKLVAEGGERGGRIIFTSGAKNPRMGDWYGIVFKNLREQSVLRNVVVEYGYKGITCYGSSPVIENVEVRYNFYIGISVEVRAKPQIRNSLIMGNGFAGVNCELAATPRIEGCVITQNTNGVIIFDKSRPDLGQVPSDEASSRGENRIYGNFEYDIYNHANTRILAQNNIWNTEDLDEIARNIYDSQDNPAYGEVVVTPYFGQRTRRLARARTLPPLPASVLQSQAPAVDTALASAEPARNQPTQNPPPPNPAGESPPPTAGQARTEEVAGVVTPESAQPASVTGGTVETATGSEQKSPPESAPEKAPATTTVAEPTSETPPASPPEPIIQEPVLEALLDSGHRQYVKRVKPQYPKIYMMLNKEGVVLIEAVVDHSGKVESYRVLRSDGDAFTQAAVDALHQFVYKPGTVGGKVVKFRVIERFVFKLER